MKPYFTSNERAFAWGLLALLIALNLAMVGGGVVLSYGRSIFYNALQAKNAPLFFRALFWYTPTRSGIPMPGFVLLGFVVITLETLSAYAQQWLQIRWRRWMTAHYVADWLDGHVHYRMQVETGGLGIGTENPEQRIQEDMDQFTSNALSLTIGLISNIVSVISYGGLLWALSGVITIAGFHISGYLFWSVVIYAVVATALTQLTGRKLARLDFMQQRYNAQFRFSLMRIRENSEAVALLNGEAEEKRGVHNRFAAIYTNFISVMNRTALVSIVTGGLGYVTNIAALVLAAPRFFAGKISFGTLTQIGQLFNSVADALLWFMNNYAAFASFAAQIERLATFRRAIEAARKALPATSLSTGETLAAHDLSVERPDGTPLLAPAAFTIAPGSRTAIMGRSGAGKSTLFRALAGIWPHARGLIQQPAGQRMFLPQKPYVPEGSLRRAVAYPHDPTSIADDGLREALRVTGLGHLGPQLDEEAPWGQILSPGEQQRLAVARAILAKPDWLFLDEATSALDPDGEASIYAAIERTLPNTTIVSITHREVVAKRHAQVLRVDEAGALVTA